MDFAGEPKMQKTPADMQQFVEKEIVPLALEVAERGFKKDAVQISA